MHRINFIFLSILISISAEIQLNSTITTTTLSMTTSEQFLSSCIYCQTKICRCSSKENLLNCSSYLLNITYSLNCSENQIWDIVDFSSRNLEYFDSTKLLSLKMFRLYLKSNLISIIYDNTFDYLGDILIELNLEMNQLKNLSSNWLNSKLIKLKILNLASNQFETFENLNNIYLPELQQLNLSCNQIKNFPYQIQQWTSLIKLDLSFNKLLTIPRFAFINLKNLTWLSLASNRYLNCIIQDSFKYLKSLKYLDLSSTNLINLDSCIFIQLINLYSLKIERVSMNCSSCWFSIAKKNSIKLFGQCLNNQTIERLDYLTDQQIYNSCLKSSIDCSIDYCEPGTYDYQRKIFSSKKLLISTRDLTNSSKKRTIEIILGIIFSIIAIIIIFIIIFIIYRWKKGKNLFCWNFFSTTSLTKNQIKQHQKQISDNNPTIIESVVTHGANMNIPSYSYHNYDYSDESTTNTKRKLYNPMFRESPTSDIRHHQTINVSDENIMQNNQLYVEN